MRGSRPAPAIDKKVRHDEGNEHPFGHHPVLEAEQAEADFHRAPGIHPESDRPRFAATHPVELRTQTAGEELSETGVTSSGVSFAMVDVRDSVRTVLPAGEGPLQNDVLPNAPTERGTDLTPTTAGGAFGG